MWATIDASLFGLSTSTALIVLFVALPILVAALVFPLVEWRHSGDPKPVRTSDILADGLPGRAEILSVRPLGSILEMRPMMEFRLRVRSDDGGEPFDLEVVQSFPRAVMREFRRGETVEVRLTPDMSRGAVVWNEVPEGY